MAPPRPDEPVVESKEEGGSSPESDADEPPQERAAIAVRKWDNHQAAAAPLQTTPLRGQDRPRPPPRAARRHPHYKDSGLLQQNLLLQLYFVAIKCYITRIGRAHV